MIDLQTKTKRWMSRIRIQAKNNTITSTVWASLKHIQKIIPLPATNLIINRSSLLTKMRWTTNKIWTWIFNFRLKLPSPRNSIVILINWRNKVWWRTKRTQNQLRKSSTNRAKTLYPTPTWSKSMKSWRIMRLKFRIIIKGRLKLWTTTVVKLN